MKIEHKVLIIFSVFGIVMGCISYLLGQMTNVPEINILLLIIVGISIKKALEKAWNINEKRDWWLKNGGTLYILLWLIVWTIFYNL